MLELRAIGSVSRLRAPMVTAPRSVTLLSRMYGWFIDGFDRWEFENAQMLLRAGLTPAVSGALLRILALNEFSLDWVRERVRS
jgi:hypothetical protein